MLTKDHYYMQQALEEAQKAAALGEVPIGAVLVYKDEIIARAHNLRETTQNALTHAESMVIQEACCAGAILQSRVPRVVYGARDIKAGCVDSLYRLLNDPRFNHECIVTEGVLADECGQILTDFFRALRERKKQEKLMRKQREE